MKKLFSTTLFGILIGTSGLLAGTTEITSLGVTPANSKYDKYVGIKVIDDNGNPLTNGKIQMNPSSKMTMYAMDLSNIDKGEYLVKVRHNEGCKEKKIYNETIVLRAIRTQDNISNNSISIPVEFDCTEEKSPYDFETAHPYANNTNITKIIPPLCPKGSICIAAIQSAYIVGETERNYDFISISQNGIELGKFSGVINAKVELDSRVPIEITFTSDASITKKGVTVRTGL